MINISLLFIKYFKNLLKVVEPYKTSENNPNMYNARYSIAYFCNVNFDITLDCLPNTWD